MQHIDEAQLHEYLDRGAVDETLASVADHIGGCATCRERLDGVRVQRDAASAILRAASPAALPMPAFETILPRPSFETFDSGYSTDPSFTPEPGQFKQTSVGMRGQAVMFAWAATVVLALGAGWMANVMYRASVANATQSSNTAETDAASKTAAPIPVTPAAAGAPVADTKRTATDQPVPLSTGPTAAAEKSDPEGVPSRQAPTGNRTIARTADRAGVVAASQEVTRPSEPAAKSTIDPSSVVSAQKSSIAPAPPSAAPSTVAKALSSATHWRTVHADSAFSALGGQVVVLAGMTIVDYAMSDDDGSFRVRIRQLTESHETVDVIQTRPHALIDRRSRVALPPTVLARVVTEGELPPRYFETMKWDDERLVTLIARDAATVRALKGYLSMEYRAR